MEKNVTDDTPASSSEQTVRVNIEGLETTLAQYVNIAQTTFDGAMFHVTLVQAIPRPITNAEELQAIQTTGIEGKIVAKVLMAPDFMRTVVDTLQTSLIQQEDSGAIAKKSQVDGS